MKEAMMNTAQCMIALLLVLPAVYAFFPNKINEEVHNNCYTSNPVYGAPNLWPIISGDVGSKYLKFVDSWVDPSDPTGNGAGLLYNMTVPMVGGNSSQSYPVLHVWGTPYQQGLAQGVLLAKQIASFLPATWAYIESQPIEVLEKYTPAWFAEMVVNDGLDAALDFTYELQKDFSPEYVFEEMEGIANGSGMPYLLIRRIMMLPDLTKGACSSVGLWGEATQTGNTLQMRALDWDMDGPFRDYSLVYVNHGNPQNSSWGHPFVQASFVGFVGALTGQSAVNLAISEIGVSYPDASFGGHVPQGKIPLPGVPFVFMLREILQSDFTIDDAANRMSNNRRTCDLILSVGDGKLGYYRDYQYSPFVLNQLDPLNYQPVNPTYHPFISNYVMYRYMDWPCTGGNYVLYNQLTKFNGNWTADLAIQNVGSVAGSGDNHLAWYDLTNQIFYISFAAPFASSGPPSAFNRQFTAFSLEQLFAVQPPTN